MDNIQKMIVGSLGLVGLIVMIVPNSDPLASKKVEASQATGATEALAPPPPAPAPAAPPPAQNGSETNGFVVDDSDIANFGKPMVDPTPPGERNQQNQQEQIQPQPYQNNTGNGQMPGNYGQPQIGAQNSGVPASTPAPT